MKRHIMIFKHGFNKEIFIGILLTLLCLFFYFVLIPTQVTLSVERNFSTLFFPKVAGIFLIVTAVGVLFEAVSKAFKETPDKTFEKEHQVDPLRIILSIIISTISYYSFHWIGFFITTATLIAAWMRLFKEKNWKTIILISIITTILNYYFFTYVMQVSFPRGVFIEELLDIYYY